MDPTLAIDDNGLAYLDEEKLCGRACVRACVLACVCARVLECRRAVGGPAGEQ